jgi:WD40 repeat protein
MQKELERIPKSCIQQRQPGSEAAFKQWQRQVVEYSGTGRQEQVPGLLSKQAIEPPMQDQIHTLRFSYDGKYLLAQDDASIYVLTRDPLQLKFRIDAPSAYPAQYSLDSKFVTFYTPDLRVEVWDLETGQRTQAFEIVWRYGCMQTALSADGRTLACIDARNALELFDTGSGDEIFEQKEIRQNSSDIFVGMGNARFSFKVMFLPMAFTPDGKYFLVSRKSGNYAIDVQARQQIPLGGAARVYMPAGFTFMSDGRLAGNPGNGVATISTFPQGVVQREVDMGSAAPFRVAKGELLLLRPIKDYAVGVLDLASNQIVRANKTAALDIYGDLSASMMGSGEVALFGASTTPLGKLALPHGHFGNLQALALSRDQSWLTVSSRSGASVWNLHASTRLYNLKSYRGACFSDDGNLYVDFPKQAKLDHSIVRLSLQQPSMTLAQKVEARHSWQRCQYLMSLRAENEPPEEAEDDSEGNRDFRYEGRARSWRDLIEGRRENETLEVRNTFTGALLWSRKFGKSVPAIFTEAENGLMAFRWRLTADGAKAEAKAMSAIGKNLSSTHDDDYLVELLDLETGKPLNAFTIDSNNGTILLGSNMTFNKDWLATEDFHGRTLVYSLKTGLRTGQFFGKPVIVGRDGATLLVRQGEGHLALYDLNDVHEIKQMTFSYPVSWTGFTHSGNIFALTADQQLYLIDSVPSDSSRAFR